MPRVVLGNPFPIFNGQAVTDPTAITQIDVPEGKPVQENLRTISYDDGHGGNSGLWLSHSWKKAPAWVHCPDDPELEAAIAEHYGIPRGTPEARGEA
jgi:hypothetical protein